MNVHANKQMNKGGRVYVEKVRVKAGEGLYVARGASGLLMCTVALQHFTAEEFVYRSLCDSADAPYVLGMEYLLSQMTDAGSEASSSTHKVAEASVMLVLQKTSTNPSSIRPYFKILSSFMLPSSS